MAQLALALLGPLQVTLACVPVAGFESQKVRALLVYLALNTTRPHSRDALAGLLWPDQPDQDARTNLRQALANLRLALGDQHATLPYLPVIGPTIQFNRASDHQIDVVAFTELLEACDQHPHRHPETCRSCAQRLQQAAELYHGDFLTGFFLADSSAFEEWVLLTRERLHQRALVALVQLASYHERRGQYAPAKHAAQRQLELEPWREASHRQLMRVLATSGERSAALVQYATCRRLLNDELGVEPEAETTALYEQIRAEKAPAAHLHPMSTVATLTPPTPLIGREIELAQLAEHLEDRNCRLLTLVGTGGIGKTRLALQVASDLGTSFPDGVAFVSLAPLRSAEFVVPAIANALGFVFRGALEPKTQLLTFLHAKDLLLVLDNVEHLLEVALLISELLAACPDLAILATGRAPLHIRGEQQFPVPPLQVPDLAHVPVVDRLTQYAAAALFVERAQAVLPSFRLTAVNTPAVAMICARLDGLPLAIELAAARTTLFAPAALLARLSSPLALLTGGAHDLPTRQQTIRATIDWSYQLLDAHEQRLLARLAVFVGSWTVEAAEAVCGIADCRLQIVADEVQSTIYNLQSIVLDGLASLLEKHLVQPFAQPDQSDQPDSERRFTMLETIREYALERLRAAGEGMEIGRRHAEYLLALVERLGPAFGGPQNAMVVEQLEVELPNLRAAFAWFEQAGDHDLALRFASALLSFWLQHGPSEGRAMLRAALAPPGAGSPLVRARALSVLGRLSVTESASWPETIAALEESLAIFRELGDLNGSAEVLDHLHLIACGRGDTERATVLIEASLQDSRVAGNPERLGWALANAADHAFSLGDDARGNALLDESQTVFAELKHSMGHGYVLLGRAQATQQRGDNRRAVALFAESAGVLRELGPNSVLAVVLFCHGQALLREGDHAQAVLLLEESLAVHGTVNGFEGDSLLLNTLGEAALAQGDHAAARARFRESQVFSRDMGDTWNSAAAQLGAGHVALDEGDTDAATTCYTAALTIFARLPDWDDRRHRTGVAAVLAALASAASHIAPEHTARMYGTAAALRASVGRQMDGPFQLPSSRTPDEHVLALVRAALGDAAFDAAWAAGQALTLEQAIAEAVETGAIVTGSD